MYAITGELVGENKLRVTYIGDMNYVGEIEGSIEVESLSPYPAEVPVGKVAVHYINPETKEQWYELEDRELTTEEKLQASEERINLLQSALDDLLMGGMM